MSILHSTQVVNRLEDYAKACPEVTLRYSEDVYGIIVFMPINFNTLSPITRAVATAEIDSLMTSLTLMKTNPRLQVGKHLV